MNVYQQLKKPIISLAPMEDVTDTVFRQVIQTRGRPDLFYTEFVNVEGLNSKGKERVIHRLKFDSKEKPIVAQLWGTKPENFLRASKLVSEMGFDGVDINMGCSVKNVVKGNAGSGLINVDRGLVKEIILATKDGSKGLPVSVKTRLGWESVDVEGWIAFLLDQDLAALAINMRTARGSEALNANWEHMGEILKLRDEINPNTLLFGNGDITSVASALEMVSKHNIDGVMIGRAAISNPWIFSGRENIKQEEKFELFSNHILLFDEIWGEEKDFHSLKKFFKAYINDFEGAVQLRKSLMECNCTEEVLDILEGYK